MTGTIVNSLGILLGTVIGCLLKKGIPSHINGAIMRVQGLATGIIALCGVLKAMFTVDGYKLSDSGGLLLLVSLVVGCLAGELLKLDDGLQRFGGWVEKKLKAEGLAQGFVSASLIFCVGAMAVIGPINDGLTGDSSVLYVKTMLDFTTSIILASTLGAGVALSAAPVFLLQGSLAVMASTISPYISDELLGMFCMVGYSLVLCIGLNFLLDTKIKVANLLPSLVIPVAYYFISNGIFSG